MQMNKISTIIISFVLVGALSVFPAQSQTWQKIEGVKAYVNKIWFPNSNEQTIVVCSDEIPTDLDEQPPTFYPTEGSGYMISENGGIDFETRLAPFFVFDIAKASDRSNTWVASVRMGALGSIIKSTDGGGTWDDENLYCSGSHQVWKIAPHPTEGGAFFNAAFNTSQGFTYTNNKFETCQTNSSLKISSRDIAISRANHSLMFISGDKAFTSGVLRSYDGGMTWLKDSSGLEGLRIHCVLPAPSNPAVVYCGADSLDIQKISHGKGIYQSLDTGKTWSLIGAPGAKVYSLAAHPTDNESFAAACGTSGVWVCGAIGKFWEQRSLGLPEGSSVRTVAIPDVEVNEDGFIVYAGTFGDGMFKSARITTTVEQILTADNLISNIYPQPASDFLNFNLQLSYDSDIAIRLIDVFGNAIINYSLGSKKAGLIHERISLPAIISSGWYIVEIRTGAKVFTEKVLVIR